MPTAPVRALKRDWLAAAAILTFLLAVAFAPVVFGQRHLMLAAWDAPSITNSGAYDPLPRPPGARVARTTDPGAPAWTIEPWFKLISEQYWGEFSLPLWNPYNAYGMPLAATAQPQPFFPLTVLLSFHVTAWTYSLFMLARLLLGGLFTYFLARQFLAFLPSLVAATTFTLSGHFMLFLNMPHLSVEVLTPGMLLAFEILARRKSWTAAASVAAMIFLITTGGMPESMFLVVAFGCLYFVCRVAFDPELRVRLVPLLTKFVAAVLLGFALSAFVLLPFVELLRIAFDAHQPSNVGGLRAGLSYDGDFASTIQYLLPLILGPPLFSTLQGIPAPSGLRGYWGVVPFFFAVAAVLFAFSRRRPAVKGELFLIAFFSITLALMVLKRFGSPLINWIGALPLSEMVVYQKYQEPLIALCVAMLAGIGFSVLVERRATPRLFLLTAVLVVAAMLATSGTYLPLVLAPHLKWAKFFYFLSLAMGIGLVIGTVLALMLMRRASSGLHPWLARGLASLLALELLVNFILPVFYLTGSLPLPRADPYAGAPYIGFVRGLNTDHSRIFARESLLYPNWSSAFGLADVRSLDAIYYGRYRNFMRNFLLLRDDGRVHGDLSDRFTGSEFAYYFDTEPERRFLALSSIKYLISNGEVGWPHQWLSEIAEQRRNAPVLGFGPDVFRFGNPVVRSIPGLFQYPPSSRVSYKVVVDPAKPIFEATAAMKNEFAGISDGAGFRLEVKDGSSIQTVFEARLDPRSVPADRAGRPVRVDLTRYAGREIELLFSTDPGPSSDVTGDLTGWVGVRFAAENEAPPEPHFKTIYNGEALVYEVPNVLPRAALYRSIEVVPDDAALARLKAPTFNPYEKALVSRESLSAGDLSALTSAPPAAPSAARILNYQSQHVVIEAETPAPALLVLNDTNYPGWRAYVNGQPAEMLTANFLFRGVVLPPGKSIVEFKYQPRSYRLGGGISFAAAGILGFLVFRERRRRRHSVTV